METAYLKIKFAPLLQDAQKSPEKCCLEIIPNISCMQNLDKLRWKQESDIIEYSIPITYKIILKKRQIKGTNHQKAKTYHSCVDLLRSSLKSNFELGSGDVSRIISDTSILNKITASLPKKEDLNVTPHNDSLSKINQSKSTTTKETAIKITEVTNIQTEGKCDNDELTNPDPEQHNAISVVLCDKLTSTDNVIISEKKQINISQVISKPKLSLSPINSINTATLSIRNTSTQIINCKINESYRNLAFECLNNRSKFFNEYKIPRIVAQIGTLYEQNTSKNLQFSFDDRSPPEIRIAQYVHYMEKELLPLSVTLDELISKCTVLDVYKIPRQIIEPCSNHLILFKSVCMYNNHITKETREKSISNRAVYSIVFDG